VLVWVMVWVLHVRVCSSGSRKSQHEFEKFECDLSCTRLDLCACGRGA